MAKRQRRKRQERRREHAKRESWKTRHSVITGAGLTAGAVLGFASSAAADNFVVDTNLDNGDGTCATGTCTLRDAVYDANDSANTSNIYFSASVTGQTITLTAGDLFLYYPTYVYGPGADRLTISGNDDSRIFTIGQKYTGDPVLISGLTLRDGFAYFGGAIYDGNSDLTVIDSRLTGNVAAYGGAIAEAGNYAYGRSTLVAYSTIDGNYAFVNGGGIIGQDSFGLIGGSTVENNEAYVAYGGGADGYGGAIFDSTISGNHAGGAGGGLTSVYAYAYNTILGNNTASHNPDIYHLFFYGIYDLVKNPDGQTVYGYSNLTGVDPQLGGLANNGGTTPTLKPAAGSPVVDKGYSGVDFDQRGFPFLRTVDNPNAANAADNPATGVVPNGTDIGAVELTLAEGPQPSPVTPPAAAPPANPFNLKKAIKKCKKKYPKGKKRKKCIKKAKKRAGVLSARSADGTAPTVRAARAEQAWRGDATRHFRGARGVRGDFSRDFKGRADWPDNAWKVKGAIPRR